MTKTLVSPAPRSEAGFSLVELLVATAILLIISSSVTSALLQMSNAQKTISNRVDMHAGIRSATELLQQEVGQAGRITLPNPTKLNGPVAGAPGQVVQVAQLINGAWTGGVSGLFQGEQIDIDAGNATQETITVTNVNAAGNTITADFSNPHNLNAPMNVYGGFAAGIIPPGGNGSGPSVLKLFGDINGDGNMVYVEYKCDTDAGNFYRNVIAFDAAAKPASWNTASQVLLNNIQGNPGAVDCFTYMPNPLPVVNGQPYVLDVAITLTVRTQTVDPVTKQFQTETKALLNVSPRNVFDVWQLASAGVISRVQPMPPSVANLLP